VTPNGEGRRRGSRAASTKGVSPPEVPRLDRGLLDRVGVGMCDTLAFAVLPALLVAPLAYLYNWPWLAEDPGPGSVEARLAWRIMLWASPLQAALGSGLAAAAVGWVARTRGIRYQRPDAAVTWMAGLVPGVFVGAGYWWAAGTRPGFLPVEATERFLMLGVVLLGWLIMGGAVALTAALLGEARVPAPILTVCCGAGSVLGLLGAGGFFTVLEDVGLSFHGPGQHEMGIGPWSALAVAAGSMAAYRGIAVRARRQGAMSWRIVP
jgi:hypothetical protein